MKKSNYMTRALQAKDPRFAIILGNLGYERADMRAASFDPEQPGTIDALRAEYFHLVGKKPYGGWDAATLEVKIAKAKT